MITEAVAAEALKIGRCFYCSGTPKAWFNKRRIMKALKAAYDTVVNP